MPDNVIYTNQVHTIIRFIEKNDACCFIPEDTANDDSKIEALLFPDSEVQPIYLFSRKDRHLFHAA